MGIFSFLRRDKKGDPAIQQSASQSAPPSSAAHLSLLMHFRYANEIASITKYEVNAATKESTRRALDRFVAEGWLVPASLQAKLFNLNGAEIRTLLRGKGLRVSGTKEQGIERLVAADPEGMAAQVAHLQLYECSPKARALIAPLIAAEEGRRQAAKERRQVAEIRCLEQIRAGDFGAASRTVANFEATNVPPRGVGIDWSHHDTNQDVAILRAIFERCPKILDGLAEGALGPLRIGAAMMYLWGTSRASNWLPAGLIAHTQFENEAAARMLLFNAQHCTRIASGRRAGVKTYEILGSRESCPACKKIAGKRYAIGNVPELPYEHCTHEMGCRCDAQPIV